ncbi:MAG: hypothetical protein U0514_03620 [Candidatus Andersenbacteria bacterium]
MTRRDPPSIPLPPYRSGPNARLYITTQVLLFAAEQLGVPHEVLDYPESLLTIGRGKHRVYLHKEMLPLNDNAADWVFNRKWLAHLVLRREGLPLPRTYLARTWDEVRAAARRLGFPRRPVVVKPERGTQGSGVAADIRTPNELRSAYQHARTFVLSTGRERYLVQAHHPGSDHRCFVLNGRCIAVARRYHPRIVGDGRSTVRDLVAQHDRRSARAAEGMLGRFVLDREFQRMLSRAKLSVDSVPAAGREVRVRSNANGSMGAWSEDVTDQVSPYIRQLVEKTARAAGLALAGVDVLSDNIAGRTAGSARPAIVEVNSRPTLLPHHYPLAGQPRQVAYEMVRALARMAARR